MCHLCHLPWRRAKFTSIYSKNRDTEALLCCTTTSYLASQMTCNSENNVALVNVASVMNGIHMAIPPLPFP